MNIPASLNSPVVNTAGSLDSPVVNTQGSLDSPVMNTRGVDFLVYFKQAYEQVYKKILLWIINEGVKTPQIIKHRGVSTPWSIFH